MSVERSAFATAMFVRLGEAVNRTFVLPLLVFYPTSRCNSRCLSCDWWKHSGEDDLTVDEIGRVAAALPSLGTRVVAFSGGEPLLRPDVFGAASMFRARGMTLQLLTSGVLLERSAERVAEHFSRVFVSLDAATDALYEDVRGINALATVGRGIARLRRVAPSVPVMARATLHRANFRELPRLIEHAKAIGLDGISFLAADVSSGAFGRGQFDGSPPVASGFPHPLRTSTPELRRDQAEAQSAEAGSRTSSPPKGGHHVGGELASLILTRAEVAEFTAIVERTLALYEADFQSGFVAESPAKLRRLPQYYAAVAGDGPFPPVRCNAPWVSVVLEADGAVRPCFFHPAVGNIRRTPLADLVRRDLRAFRSTLDIDSDPTCGRCVCSLNTGWRRTPWTS
jgi:MoaA/NifB/PqqE/SkfB family radical SAM enzyme